MWSGECSGALTAAALTRSWLIAEFAAVGEAPLQGETVARLNAVLGGAAVLGSAAPETRPGEPPMPHAVTGPESRVR